MRAHDNVDALNRVRKRMFEYGLVRSTVEWDALVAMRPEKEDGSGGGRLSVYAGDISKPYLGLREADYQRLAQQVATVYQCAAHVNWLLSYEGVRAANVVGTKEVLRFCFQQETALQKKKRLCYVSTIGVLEAHPLWTSVTVAAIKEDEPLMPYIEHASSLSGYAQSKFVAEELVHEAIRRGGCPLPSRLRVPVLHMALTCPSPSCCHFNQRLASGGVSTGVHYGQQQ